MAIINGTAAAETLTGTADSDKITGGLGNDLLKGGAGNDLFIWNSGDGNDTIAGGVDFDTLRFNASAGAEIMALTASSGHVRLTSNAGPTTLDLNDVERVEINAGAGLDSIAVDNLAGTDLKQVAINLGGADGAQDSVVVNADGASSTITLSKTGGVVSVAGLSAKTTIGGSESLDYLRVNALGGNDTINAAALPFATLLLTLDGGDGNDKLTGSQGEDTIWGGTGNDTVAGGGGYDAVSLGDGNDLYLWAAGDGGDLVQGDAGFDTLRASGNKSDEAFTIYASGGYAHLGRSMVEDTTISTIERLVVNAAGGADSIVVSDLTTTDVAQVDINLAADSKVDTVTLAGDSGANYLSVGSVGGKVVTQSLGATVTISTTDKLDKVVIDGGGDNDIIDANSLAAGIVRLQIQGGVGDDTILGSAGNDTVSGGDGNDFVFLGGGNDRYIWTTGDDIDTIDGQSGMDTLQVNGILASDIMLIIANGERVQFTHLPSFVSWFANGFERIELNGGGGADILGVYDLTGTDVKQVVANVGAGDAQNDTVLADGTTGNDIITVTQTGSLVSVSGLSAQLTVAGAGTGDTLTVEALDGDDKIDASKMPVSLLTLALDGGTGNDTVIGGAGNDFALLGAGNDLFLWNPGQGSDTIDGGADFDILRFTGSAGSETIGIAANGTHVALSRNVGATVLDIELVERLHVRALGGADQINIGDLTGVSATTRIDVDLAAVAGGTKADGKVDMVAIAGTSGGDSITVTNSGGTVVVAGLQAKVNVTHADKADRLVIDGGALGDVIDASGLAAGKVALQLVGGLGGDLLIGSAGNDTVLGGDGGDVALLGAGNDLFIWNPGDDNDVLEGQSGTDTLRFNGSALGEIFQIAPNGGRVTLLRDVASVVMDLNDIERIQLNALAGADTIFVNDVSGTDLKQVAIDLGASDAAADTVYLVGGVANETVTVALAGSAVTVTGLAAQVSVAHAEGANDLLRVYAAVGDDTLNASTLPAGNIRLWLEGGDGNDVITGSAGNDRLDGDEDDDVLNGGAGKDTLFGGTGNDRINGGSGNDLIQGNEGNDRINGGAGNDTIEGGEGNDTIDVSLGNDIVRYTSVLDGKDVITGFDGNATGGQDVLDLNALFDSLNVLTADRTGRVSITDLGATVNIAVDADGNAGNGFELLVATLHTTDIITKGITGADVIVGTG